MPTHGRQFGHEKPGLRRASTAAFVQTQMKRTFVSAPVKFLGLFQIRAAEVLVLLSSLAFNST